MWTYPGLQPVSCDDRTRVQEIPLATVRLTICGEPPVAMIWNPDLAPTLHPVKVRRWFAVVLEGGRLDAGLGRRPGGGVRRLCVSSYGPSIDAAGHRIRLRRTAAGVFRVHETAEA